MENVKMYTFCKGRMDEYVQRPEDFCHGVFAPEDMGIQETLGMCLAQDRIMVLEPTDETADEAC